MTAPGPGKFRDSIGRRGKRGDEEPGGDEPPADFPRPEYRRSRWRSWRAMLGLSTLLAVAIVAAAPWLLAHCGGLDRLLRAAPIPGSLSIGSASLAWWSPVVLDDVELRDEHGELMAKIDHLASDKTLFALAIARTDLGRILIQHPRLLVVTRDGGSNLEDYCSAIQWPQAGGSSPLAAELDVTDGEILLDDSLAKRQYHLDAIKLSLKSSGDPQAPLDAALSAKLVHDGQVGELNAELHAGAGGSSSSAAPASSGSTAPAPSGSAASAPSAGSPLAIGRAHIEIVGAPLALFQPLLRRALPGAETDGQLVAKISGSWGDGDDHQSQTLDVDLAASDASLSAPSLSGDRLRLAGVHVPCRLTYGAGSLAVEQLAVECDVGRLSSSGRLRVAGLGGREFLSALAQQSFQVDGQLDLAKLAKLLPATLRIRDGVEITASQIALSASGAPDQAGGAWRARLEGSDLAALNTGRQVTWQEPLVVEINGHDGPQGPVIDAAKVESTFLQVQAAGAANNLNGAASFDLAKLAAEAAQFVDLGSLGLGGSGSVNFAWQQAADQTFALRANIDAKDMQVSLPGRPAWVETALSGELDVRGLAAGVTVQRFDRASLEIIGNQERLAVELAKPASDAANVALAINWQGPVNDWVGRLALWIDVAGWELAGDGSLSGQLALAGGRIAFDQVSLKADRAHVWLPGLYFDEPHLEITCGGAWDGAHRTLQIPNLTVLSGQAGAQLTNLQLSVDGNGAMTTTGDVAYKAEIGQIVRWARDPRQPGAWIVTGQASGAGRLAFNPGVSSLELSAAIDNLQLTSARPQDAAGRPAQNVSLSPTSAWREQQMKLSLAMAYDHARDLLTVSQAEIAGSALRLALAGSVAELNTRRNLDLKGQLEYDWKLIAPLLRPYLGPRVSIAGHDTRPFTLQGSWPAGEVSPAAQWQQLTGGGGIGWTDADVYGIVVGPGQLAASFARGVIQFQPLDLAVSGGMIHLNEQWRILPAPGELRMAKGRLVEHVQVTPEVCKQALQFVAPVLAQVTEAEGTFSVDIEGGKLTFGSAAGCDVVGHLLTDQAHVQAGPLAQQFALLARRFEQLLLADGANPNQPAAVLVNLNNENVDFRVVGGRVYHRNLRFKIGPLQIVTQGSVGFDESLEMLAEVALEESLLAGRPLLKQLLGRPLQIPLTGSLGSPQLDLRGVEDISRRMARNAANSVISKPIEAIEKPLENLFRP